MEGLVGSNNLPVAAGTNKLPELPRNGSSHNRRLFELVRNVWLGGRDSNPDSQIQSLVSYHWTTSQQRNRIYGSLRFKSTGPLITAHNAASLCETNCRHYARSFVHECHKITSSKILLALSSSSTHNSRAAGNPRTCRSLTFAHLISNSIETK